MLSFGMPHNLRAYSNNPGEHTRRVHDFLAATACASDSCGQLLRQPHFLHRDTQYRYTATLKIWTHARRTDDTVIETFCFAQKILARCCVSRRSQSSPALRLARISSPLVCRKSKKSHTSACHRKRIVSCILSSNSEADRFPLPAKFFVNR